MRKRKIAPNTKRKTNNLRPTPGAPEAGAQTKGTGGQNHTWPNQQTRTEMNDMPIDMHRFTTRKRTKNDKETNSRNRPNGETMAGVKKNSLATA